MTLRSVGPPGEDGEDPQPEPSVTLRRIRDLFALVLISTGGSGLLVSLFYIHPLAATIAASVGAITVGVLVGLE